jgi:LDH2 family malate/lactate/ureidoglycolate dehydrogenase
MSWPGSDRSFTRQRWEEIARRLRVAKLRLRYAKIVGEQTVYIPGEDEAIAEKRKEKGWSVAPVM